MSIRLRYYLAILPLFIGLGLINGLLLYYLDRNEMRWALTQRAEGAAAAVAGFWPALEQAPAKARDARLQAFSERLGGLGIVWFEHRDGTWHDRALLAHADLAPPAPSEAVAQQLRHARLAWQFIERPTAERDLNVGYARLDDEAGKPRGVVAVAEADVGLREATEALIEQLVTLGGLLLLVGVVVCEWLTRFAKTELGTLSQAARNLAAGQYLSSWPAGRIRELNDLGGTLLTMASLLADGSNQTRRRFFEAELLPAEDELADCLRANLNQADDDVSLRQRCAWRVVGKPPPEDFFGVRADAAGWHIVVGRCRVTGDSGDELRRSLRAAACRDYLLMVAAEHGDDARWAEALALFPCEKLQRLFLPRQQGAAPSGWTLDVERARFQSWSPRVPRALIATLPPAGLHSARAYKRQFPERDVQQVTGELALLLSARFHGIIVVCETTAAVPEPQS